MITQVRRTTHTHTPLNVHCECNHRCVFSLSLHCSECFCSCFEWFAYAFGSWRQSSVLPARLLLPFSQLSGSNTALHILAHLKWLWHFQLWALKQCGGFRVITGMIVEWTCFCVCERECTFLYAGAVLIKKMFSLNHLIFFPTHIFILLHLRLHAEIKVFIFFSWRTDTYTHTYRLYDM